MRTLLALVLSVAILVSSSSPALAQIVPVARGAGEVRAAAQAGVVAQQAAELVERELAAVTAGEYASAAAQQIQQQVAYMVQVRQFESLQQLASAGKTPYLAEQILALQPLERMGLLQKEFIALSLTEQATASQKMQAVAFYKQDLAAHAPALAAAQGENIAAWLATAPEEAQQACRGALADGVALGFVGSQEDAAALIAFYESASKGVFGQVAEGITARGLLRMEAYDAFNAWAAGLPQRGTFWTGLAAYAQAAGLPISLHAEQDIILWVLPSEGGWLARNVFAGRFVADPSREATAVWLTRSETPLKLTAQPAAKSTTQVAAAPLGQVQTDLTSLPLSAPLDLTTLAPSLSGGGATAQAPVQQAGGASQAVVTTDHSGIVGDFPVFAIANTAQKWVAKLRSWMGRKSVAARPSANEPAGLHDNHVYNRLGRVTPPPAYDAEDLMGAESLPAFAPIAGEGFQFTLERAGEETILSNVNVGISSSIKLANGYNRLVQTENHVFELRNLTLNPKKMERFYFVLSTENGALQTLIEGAQKVQAAYPLRIKIRFNGTEDFWAPFKQVFSHKKTVVQLPIYSGVQGNSWVMADVDAALLPAELVETAEQGYLVTKGNRIWFVDGQDNRHILSQYYVRLPKEESAQWAQIFQNNPATTFNLNVYPTQNKTNFMTYAVSPMRIGTGKAFGPIMSSLGLGDFWATGIPLFANNGLSIVLGPLMPVLRRIGEANMYRMGVALYALASVGALSLGLNGFMGVENATATQVGGLIGVLMAMGFGGVLINTTQNNLVASNIGAMPAMRNKKAKNIPGASATTQVDAAYLWQRIKEIFSSKGQVEMRDSVRYQWLSALKNVGTFGFLALPFFFNVLSKAVGASVRADFSLSFWALGGLSLYALFKVLRMPLKDSFPRDLGVLRKMAGEKEIQTLNDIETQLASPQADWNFTPLAKQLNSVLRPYARATAYKTGAKYKEVAASIEVETVQRLHDGLLARGVEPQLAQQAIDAMQGALDTLGRRNISVWDVFKMKGVFPALSAMVLLTVHELGTSSEFAYQVKEVAKTQFGGGDVESTALGMFLAAFFLYGTSFFSRLAGNWLALRTSEGSMYAFSSAMSVLGTGMLIAANGNLPTLFGGAILATFGMGNFFSQMFEYIVKLHPKFRPELAVLIGYTMPLAALLTAGIHTLAEWGVTHGVNALGLMVCQGALIASFFAAPKMFADSSLVKAAQHYGKKIWNFLKFGRNNTPQDPAAGLDAGNAATAN